MDAKMSRKKKSSMGNDNSAPVSVVSSTVTADPLDANDDDDDHAEPDEPVVNPSLVAKVAAAAADASATGGAKKKKKKKKKATTTTTTAVAAPESNGEPQTTGAHEELEDLRYLVQELQEELQHYKEFGNNGSSSSSLIPAPSGKRGYLFKWMDRSIGVRAFAG
jgi:hypothetical protein